MSIHCLESGCIEKYAPLGNLHPSALEIALGQFLGPQGANCLRGHIFQYIPSRGTVFLYSALDSEVRFVTTVTALPFSVQKIADTFLCIFRCPKLRTLWCRIFNLKIRWCQI